MKILLACYVYELGTIQVGTPSQEFKKIKNNGISHFGFLLCPNSDQGTHFKTEINHLFAKPQRYSLKFHALYHLIFNPQGKWNIKM